MSFEHFRKCMRRHPIDGFESLLEIMRRQQRNIVIFDLETTTLLNSPGFGITQVGMLYLSRNGKAYIGGSLVNPENPISPKASELTGITQDMVDGLPNYAQLWGEAITAFFSRDLVIGFNSSYFDFPALQSQHLRYGLSELRPDNHLDVRILHQKITNDGSKGNLIELCKRYGVDVSKFTAHNAESDVLMTGLLLNEVIYNYGAKALQSSAVIAEHHNRIRETDNRLAMQNAAVDDIRNNGYSGLRALAARTGMSVKDASFAIGSAVQAGVLDDEAVRIPGEVDRIMGSLEEAIQRAWASPEERGKLKPLKFQLDRILKIDTCYVQLRIALNDRERRLAMTEGTNQPAQGGAEHAHDDPYEFASSADTTSAFLRSLRPGQ